MAFQCRCRQLPCSAMRISFILHFAVSGFSIGILSDSAPPLAPAMVHRFRYDCFDNCPESLLKHHCSETVRHNTVQVQDKEMAEELFPRDAYLSCRYFRTSKQPLPSYLTFKPPPLVFFQRQPYKEGLSHYMVFGYKSPPHA